MKPRGLIVALVVSVALNLFLGGLIVGGAVVARRMAETRPAVLAGQNRTPLWRAGDELPLAKRRAFRQMFRQAGQDSREDIRQSRAIRREAIAAMEADSFDAVATTARMTQARQIDTAARGQVEAKIMAFAATLTPEERKVLAAGLRRSMAGQLREPVAR